MNIGHITIYLSIALLSLFGGGLYLYLFLVGLFSAVLFASDKYAAIKHKRRIPEKELLASALLGGAPFALITMLVLRHKVSKPEIFMSIFIFSIIQFCVILIV